MFDRRVATVLIVEDDPAVRDALETLMAAADFEYLSYGTAEGLLGHALPQNPCCLWVDLQLPGMTGLELQTELSRRGTRIPLLFFSANASATDVETALNAGALHFFCKPVDAETMLDWTLYGLQVSAATSD